MNRPDSLHGREAGVVLPLLLLITIALFAAAGGVTMLTNAGLRASGSSNEQMQAFYAADSGFQLGSYMVRASGGTVPDTSFEESIGSSSATVSLAEQSPGIYEIRSTGTSGEGTITAVGYIEVHVDTFKLAAATEMVFGNGVELEGAGVPVRLDGTSSISGVDHSPAGVPLADQSKAVYGLGMNTVPGNRNFSLSGTGTVAGTPAARTNALENHGAQLQAIRDYAKKNADITINGSRTLGAAATGTYGTAAAPKVVYVNLGEEGTLTLQQTFTGYGTLVINVSEAEESVVLRMRDAAAWNGLVLVRLGGEAEIEGGSLIHMTQSAKIVGGLAMYFTGEEIEVEDGGRVLRLADSAKILTSSQLLASTPGLSGANATVELLAYWIE